MARKNIQPIVGQTPLFISPPTAREGQPPHKSWQEIEQSPANQLEGLVGDSIGPHTDVVERAERIIEILDKISNRNSLNGMSYAIRRREYKKPIWERYLDGTPRVIRNSLNKAERLDEEITEDLVALSGFRKIKGRGFLTRGEVRAKIEKDDRDFEALYGPKYKISDTRKKYRKVQLGFLPEGHPLKTKPAKSKHSGADEQIAA